MTLDTLFQENVAAAFERQLRLAEVLEDRPWQFDMAAGTLTFGKKGFFSKPIVLPIQVLGTESEGAGTWLWSWANAASHLPPALTEASLQLRAFGERENVEALVKREVPLAELNGHQVGMIASGRTGAAGYYRCPYEGGAMFALIPDQTLLKPVSHPVTRVLTVFPQVADAVELAEHRLALTGLLRAQGFTIADGKTDSLVGTLAGKGEVRARFDERGRLLELEGDALPG